MTDPTAPPPQEPWQGGTPPQQPPPAYPPAGPPPPPGAYPQAGGYPPPGAPAGPAGYQPTPAGYPGAQGFAPPPKKRRKWPWIVTGVVVVLVAVIVIAAVVFGRKGSADPHTAANKFWSALVAHDTKKAEKYVCDNKDLGSNAEFKTLVNELTGFDIGAETGSGNTRIYPVTAHLSDPATPEVVFNTTVQKKTGEWYVCELAVGP